jgi:hypothetical protein
MNKAPLPKSLVSAGLFTASCTLFACAAQQQHVQAESAYASGDFLEAADFYAADARLVPLDSKSAALLEEARRQAVSRRLEHISAIRRRGDRARALAELRPIIAKRDAWHWQPPQEIARRFAEEIQVAGEVVRGEVEVPLRAGDPLLAEAVYEKSKKSIAAADFAPVRDALERAIRVGGKQRCIDHARALKEGMPHTAFVVSRFCEHFGTEGPPVTERPEVTAKLSTSGGIRGFAMSDVQQLGAALDDGFRSTPFYGGGSPRGASAVVSGQQSIAFSAHAKTIEAAWTEAVTIGRTVVAGSSQNGATTELVAPSISSTDPASSSGPWSSTLTRDRHHAFVATEHVGRYVSAVLIRIDLGPAAPPVEIHANQDRTETGLYHDEEFGPAGIHPERPSLHSKEEFIALEIKFARYKLIEGLKEHWRKTFCEHDLFALEDAARCASGAAEYPPAVRAALESEFRGDVALLSSLLAEKTQGAPDGG